MKSKTEFICRECGYKSSKWYGRCPNCKDFNTFEETVIESEQSPAKTSRAHVLKSSSSAVTLNNIQVPEQVRTKTGIGEFDRVLGGGIVNGSVTLLSGEPGIGKSTILLQICSKLGENNKLLYVSGEESQSQLKLRAQRLCVESENLYILSETEISEICDEIELLTPDIVIVDSIQTMYDSASSSIPGSVTQVKNSAQAFIRLAKTKNIAVIIVGHVNKDGAIAGPKVLEHMVDTVLYFEGEKQHSYRILRSEKNRFGSTNEIGVFEMLEEGLSEVENPSEMLLSQRISNVSGNCTVCVMEGTRPILTEIQALVSLSSYPAPKRMSAGFDYNRMSLVAAVLEKRLGLKFSTQDIYMNVAGGLKIFEPSSDLAAALALISGYKDIPIPDNVVAMGELGLSGECRAVGNINLRINESIRLGFTKILIPYKNYLKIKDKKYPGAEIVPIRGIFDSLKLFS